MRNQKFRLKSPIIATVGGLAFLAAAAAGGSATYSDEPAKKGDRFTVTEQALCGGKAWPHITAECVAWRNHEPETRVRFITVSSTDRSAATTVLTRVPAQ